MIILHFKQFCHSFSINLTLYVVLYLFLHLFPNHFQKFGLLNNQLNFVNIVQKKADSAAIKMQESNLGLNFIGNYHKLSPLESEIFQSSGLVHLLAISGGQILPVVSLISFIISSLLYKFYRNKKKPQEIMTIRSKINSIFGFLISFFISILYGGTGALLRVSWLNFFKKLNYFNHLQNSIIIFFPNISEQIINKFLILLILSLLFGNIFVNYSFILSALGACCAEISALFCNIFQSNSQKKFYFQKIYKLKLFQEFIITITTCILVGVILGPLTTNSIINSCLANLFAIPLVTFLVTPFALLSLIIPQNFFLFDFIIQGLDQSLIIFKYIATTFSVINSGENVVAQNKILFSPIGLLYLNLILIILWSSADVIRERKITKLRNALKIFQKLQFS